jgi:hypothetical protein
MVLLCLSIQMRIDFFLLKACEIDNFRIVFLLSPHLTGEHLYTKTNSATELKGYRRPF